MGNWGFGKRQYGISPWFNQFLDGFSYPSHETKLLILSNLKPSHLPYIIYNAVTDFQRFNACGEYGQTLEYHLFLSPPPSDQETNDL